MQAAHSSAWKGRGTPGRMSRAPSTTIGPGTPAHRPETQPSWDITGLRPASHIGTTAAVVQAGVRATVCAAGHGFDQTPSEAAGIRRTRRQRSSAGKETRKAVRSSGRSQNAPSGAIRDFHSCGTSLITCRFYLIALLTPLHHLWTAALLLARLVGEAGLGWLDQEPAALRALAAYFGDDPSGARATTRLRTGARPARSPR